MIEQFEQHNPRWIDGSSDHNREENRHMGEVLSHAWWQFRRVQTINSVHLNRSVGRGRAEALRHTDIILCQY